jgi:hypothetical protein
MAILRLATARTTHLPPERAALATAIEVWRAARDDVAAIERAVSVAYDNRSTATAARDTAAAAVAAARTDAVEHLTQAALGTPSTAPTTVRAARGLLAEAEEAVEDAQAVLDGLRARLDPAKDTLGHAVWSRDAAVIAVAKSSPEVLALLGDVERLQTELTSKGAALLFLHQNNALEIGRPGSPDWQGNTRADIALNRLNSPPRTWLALHNDIAPAGEAPYRSWLAALTTDAAAQLPGEKI